MARFAVIGGGPMGLATAYELLKEGHEVFLYEAGSVIGGMSASFNFSGIQIERFYHFICQSDKAFLELLRDLDIDNKLKWTKAPMGFYYEGRLYEWGSFLGLLKFTPISILGRIRYGVHAFTSIIRKDWEGLDGQDAATWLKKWIGDKTYDVTWKSLFDQKFYQYTNNLSAAWIWSRIHRMGNSAFLGYLEGGSEVLLRALDGSIKDMGGVVLLNTPVINVETQSELSNPCGKINLYTANGVEEFNAVISTIPVSYVPKIFSDLPCELLDQYKAVENIAVVCVLVKLNQKVTNNFWLNISDSRMDIPGIIEYTNLRPMEKTIVYVPYYMPKDHPMYTDKDIVFEGKVRKYLNNINANISDNAIESIEVSRYSQAQPICPPGYLQMIPPARTKVFGVYIADTSYYYPEDRSISESVRMGKELAHMAIKDVV